MKQAKPFAIVAALVGVSGVAGFLYLSGSGREPVSEETVAMPSSVKSAEPVGSATMTEPAARSSWPVAPRARATVSPSSQQSTEPRPPSRATPRELLVRAQQSGTAEDALLAAKSISTCRRMIGAGHGVRDALVESGVNMPAKKVDALLAGVDKPERACQELDGSMLAQYEPMLRQAMKGGIKGAAALWWLSPEANALPNPVAVDNAKELLRRDALACDKRSLAAYQAASFKYSDSFDATEAAAVEAAATALEKQGKLKGNSSLGPIKALMHPYQTLKVALNQDAVRAKTEEILRSCE